MADLIYKKFQIKSVENEKALYNIAELKEYIDFPVKRVYFAQNFKVESVGGHCHKTEEELFIMARGNGTAMLDKGEGLEEIPFKLGEAIYVSNYVWHAFKDFSPDAVFLALSSTNYNPDRSDYIENYDDFKEAVKNLP
jgi:oxalate decarboxylase/phosphoglucose isomerase-like protein (cupin superfamily)